MTSSARGDNPRTFEMTFTNKDIYSVVLALYWIEFRKIYCVFVVYSRVYLNLLGRSFLMNFNGRKPSFTGSKDDT